MKKKTILIVAAHPDDEILGCGGTAALYSKQGNNVYSLILGEGITARFNNRKDASNKLLERLRNVAMKANKIIGVKQVFFGEFPDNRFDGVELLDLVKMIEKVKAKLHPDIVFIHHPHDRNVDHQLSHEAALIAFRPLPGEKATLILSFEIAGSMKETQSYSKNGHFIPNYFTDIEKTIGKKLDALKAYGIEMRHYPHPRSIEGLRILAKARGLQVGKKSVEAFQLIRFVE